MKAFIFVPSIQLVRGRKLAIQAGFFCSLQKVFTPIKRRPAYTERLRNVSPAKVAVLTAVFGRPLFCSTYVNTVHNVHTQRSFVRSGAKLPIEATTSNPIKRPPYYTANTCASLIDLRIGINTNN